MTPWIYPNIEGERAKRNWTQETIAQKLNITTKTYRRWVTEGFIPSNKLMELSKIFNCSVDYLLETPDDVA